MNSREWCMASEALQQIGVEFLRKCRDVGIDVLVYLIYRDEAEQNALYEQGRTKPGSIVTNAKGGQSPHNKVKPGVRNSERHHNELTGKVYPASEAFDCVPMKNGKPQWNDAASYKIMGKIGRSLGLEWGGDFKKIHDSPHFQLPQRKTN